ncbi:MAG: DNA polymerase III subunit delta [Candidatus Taylorbacteria bacterium]|nr:DNA polymerase III subunit delta [Candidatus Taylorbacteria bacterium]
MIIFIYGSDAYRLKQAKDGLVSRYKAKYPGGMNRFYFDLSEQTDFDLFENAVKSHSFFNEHKLIVCKNIFSRKTTAELIAGRIKEYAIAQAADITLIAVEDLTEKELVAKSKELFKLLSDNKNIVKNIEPLSMANLTEWARKEFETRGCSIEPNALNNLINMVGNDSWAIINEIEKLTNYRTGEITTSDTRDLVHAKVDMNIFDLIDALGAKNRLKATELLYKELKTGRDPYYILTMVTYQFRNLLMVKDLKDRGFSGEEISRKAKLHPFVVKKTLHSPFNTRESVKIYNNLLALDTGFKVGKLSIEDSLYHLIKNAD